MNYESPELQLAFDQGAQAAHAGGNWRADCPYPDDTLRSVIWHHGFNSVPPAETPAAPFWLAPGTVEGYVAPTTRAQRVALGLLALACCGALSALLGFALGYLRLPEVLR